MDNKHRGILRISPELLLKLLDIKGQILDARICHFDGGQLEIVLSGPEMPLCPEGAHLMTIPYQNIR